VWDGRRAGVGTCVRQTLAGARMGVLFPTLATEKVQEWDGILWLKYLETH